MQVQKNNLALSPSDVRIVRIPECLWSKIFPQAKRSRSFRILKRWKINESAKSFIADK